MCVYIYTLDKWVHDASESHIQERTLTRNTLKSIALIQMRYFYFFGTGK